MASDGAASSDFVSIVVADSTRIHTQLLADALRNDRSLQVVAAASNSSELMGAITRVPIDVVVISHDLDNQRGHGTAVLREMRVLRPQIKGVILLDSSQPAEVLECFRAGARGIFSKEERIESLCKCIRSVHEGQIWARSVDLEHALDALASTPLVRSTNHKGLELLSERERQVIQHVAGGMSNREIAVALELSPHTVKNYLFRIFDKLGVSSRTELLYLTMNNPKSSAATENPNFSEILAAAETGDTFAQLLVAEHFCPGGEANANADAISAYMWYLLAERTMAGTVERIDVGKKSLSAKLTPEQVLEAETQVALRLKNPKKQSSGAVKGEDATGSPRKMHAGAR